MAEHFVFRLSRSGGIVASNVKPISASVNQRIDRKSETPKWVSRNTKGDSDEVLPLTKGEIEGVVRPIGS